VFDPEMIAYSLTVAKERQFINISSDTSLEVNFMTMPLLVQN
jgi:hypothetical protein